MKTARYERLKLSVKVLGIAPKQNCFLPEDCSQLLRYCGGKLLSWLGPHGCPHLPPAASQLPPHRLHTLVVHPPHAPLLRALLIAPRSLLRSLQPAARENCHWSGKPRSHFFIRIRRMSGTHWHGSCISCWGKSCLLTFSDLGSQCAKVPLATNTKRNGWEIHLPKCSAELLNVFTILSRFQIAPFSILARLGQFGSVKTTQIWVPLV